MKELLMKEKAKAYNKALEIAKKNYDAAQDLCEGSQIGVECFKDTLANIFPELKESGDEWIRKEIIKETKGSEVRLFETVTNDEFIAWLEKQGEKEQDERYENLEELLAADDIYQMSMNDEMIREAKEKAVNALHGMCIGRLLGIEKQGEQNLIMAKSPQLGEQKPADKVEPKDFNGIDPHFGKPADKAEPKFRVRDWIVRDGKILQISHIDKVLDGTFHYWFTEGTWLSSAKMEDAHLWTIEDAKDGDVLADNLGVILFKSIRDNNVINYYAYLSGLFAVQKDEEYWGYAVNCTLSPATKEQRERFFAAMHDAGYEWDAEKKELKRIEQKPATMSLDAYKLFAISAVEDYYDEKNPLRKCLVDWLNSLKDKVGCEANCTTMWKPSEEQIKALKDACDEHWEPDGLDPLYTLYQDLKKLREE